MSIKSTPFPKNEKARLEALLSYNVLDTFSEEEFDNITKLVAYICKVPIAFISLIDEKRQWFKSRIGLDDPEMDRDISFCQYTIMNEEILEVTNALESETFKDNPLVTGTPYIRFYAGAPLTTPDGFNIGALCVIDQVPRQLDEEQKKALSTLAKQVITQLELRQKNFELKHQVENLAKKALETITLELDSYKLALDETSCVIMTDEKGTINFVNDIACKVTKYRRDELIGQDLKIVNAGFHSKEFFFDLWKTISSGSIWKNEIKNKAKDNSIYWADTTIVPFLDINKKPYKYVALQQDITKQKKEEHKITQFFNLSLDYLCVSNTKGFFETLSPAFSRELGFSNEELLAQPFFNFIHEDDIEITRNEINKLAQGIKSSNFETRFKCKNGGYKLLSWNAAPDKETGVLYAIARDITASKRINEENKRLSLVAKNTDNIIVITDKNRKIEWVNQPFESLTGYSLAEVIGKKPAKFLQYEGTNPDTVLKIREALNKQTSFKGEIKNRSKAGRTYWLEVSISPVFNDNNELINFIAIESDITEKKQKDLRITNLLATQDSIFNGVGYGVIFTDAKGIIKRTNKAISKLTEYSEEELVNKKTPIVFHDLVEIIKRSEELTLELGYKINPDFDTLLAKTKNYEVDGNEWTFISKSGKRIPVWVSLTCIKNTEDIILGYLGVVEDYTTKKQVELELINAKNLAEQAVYAKDSFLANMSHEIRTPLNAIIGFTELIAQSQLDNVQYEYIQNIQTAGDNLLLIINDILDLSKIESGQLVIESYPFNPKTTLKHIYDLLKVKADKGNLEFSLFLDAEMPEFIVGDKGRINQIIMNLAGNAIKFTESGEVIISVKKVSETDTTVILKFSVKDTGIGISEDKLTTMFERFTQAEASTTRKFGGTGLGLNIVKQLVELQNGKIQVKSTLGKGSDFYFSLEFKKPEASFTDTILENHVYKKLLGKISILLCEDNELNQRLAKNVIQKFGFDLEIANNGQEGLDLLAKNRYDLILMDLQMPVKDGYQTTIYIRNELKLTIPIIAMTAHSLIGEQQKCFDIGMNAYVAKPFKQQELLDKIQSVMEINVVAEGPKSVEKPTNITRSIDLSYLDELAGADDDFNREMMGLFIEKIPTDLTILEQAIEEKNSDIIKKVAHNMKSSFGMFRLEKEVDYLIELEHTNENSFKESNFIKVFLDFKTEINYIIDVLKKEVSNT